MSRILELAKNGLPFEGELLIDSHCHAGPTHLTFIPFNNMEAIVSDMDRISIHLACISALTISMMGDPFLQNDRVAEYVNGFPGKFKGYVTLNMNYKDSLLDELVRGEDNNLKLGIKLHIYRQKYEMDDEALIPVFQHLNRRRAICLHHYFGPAEKLESLLRAFPDIVFIEGHSLNEYDHLVRKYDNLYINTCAQLGYRRIEEHVRIIGSEKIVYGSDFVALDPSFGFGPVAYAKITDREKRNILGLNMKRILDRIKD